MTSTAISKTLTIHSKAAVRAIFRAISLLFIKYLKVIIKCRGTFRVSGLFPVFTFMHDLVNVHFTQCTMPKPPISCVNPLKNDDKLCLRSCLGDKNV